MQTRAVDCRCWTNRHGHWCQRGFSSFSLSARCKLRQAPLSRLRGARVIRVLESLVSVCIAIRCPCIRFLTTLPTARLQICLGLPYDISAYITFFACLLSSFFFFYSLSLFFFLFFFFFFFLFVFSFNIVDNSMSLSRDYAATAFNGEQGTMFVCFFVCVFFNSMLLPIITTSI